MDETPSNTPTAPAPDLPAQFPPPRERRVLLPALLFIATFLTTTSVGGWAYSCCIMLTLLAHELGHFLQTVRYAVPSSLPYFIPIPPPSPLGTMGAFIVMAPRIGNRRSLFDIAVTGPLAGLVPALMFSVVGLQWSEVVDMTATPPGQMLGEPLLFRLLAYLTFGPLPEGHDIALHAVAYAGWVGILVTALNLFPIGQLDGGHILYALLLRRAHPIAQLLLIGCMIGIVLGGYWGWLLMVVLLMLMGPAHPPTADDSVPLGPTRTILGWICLLFVPLGFTPAPFPLDM